MFAVIRRLRERQLGVIYISHRLEEIFQIADRVTVLKDGSGEGTFLVARGDARGTSSRGWSGASLDPHRPRQERPPADSPVALEVRGLSDAGHAPGVRPRFRDITLRVRCRGDRRAGRAGRGRAHRAGAGDLRRLARA